MSSRWERVKEVFQGAMELEAGQRAAFLNSACGLDSQLRAEIEKLIAATDNPSEYLQPPAPDAAIQLVVEASQHDLIGQRVGSYRITQLIAVGGMGTVYRGERDDGEFDRVVAVKVIKPGLHTKETATRFRRETQTLARLEHPNIARLIDGGVLEGGAPYLIMEFIEGLPIDKYSDELRLDVPARLRLLSSVCEAVRYAHQNLVVHRDLKPRNILVDNRGEVKLLDFGISKLLSEDSDLHPDPTMTLLRVMTPQYASPEQVRGEPVTTASDVYSLGVLLYELLTGHRPYRIIKGREHEVARIISEVDPDTPSESISRVEEIDLPDGTTGTVTPAIVGKLRGEPPNRLRKRLRGDLDTIVMTALQKDRTRRYASVERLLEDLKRYLAGMPVKARRDTFTYRAVKFARRNKVAMVASAVAAFALLVGAAGTTMALLRAKQSLRLAEKQSHIASTEAMKAERVTAFVQNLIASPDPTRLGKDVTVLQALDGAAARIESELVEDLPTQAAVENTIGGMYFELGQFQKAEPHLKRAMELQLRLSGKHSLDYAVALGAWGGLREALGDYDQAEVLYRESLAALRLHAKTKPLSVAGGLNNLGALLEKKGNFEEAEPLLREALDIRSALLGEESELVCITLQNLAVLLDRKGDAEGARLLYEKSLEIARKILGDRHVKIAAMASNLGMLLNDIGELDAAETLIEEALSIDRQHFGDVHPSVGADKDTLASIVEDKGNLDRAIELRRESLDTRILTLGNDHPDTASNMNNLATLLVRNGDLGEAEELHERAYQIRQKVLGPDSQQAADSLINIGTLLVERKAYDQAKEKVGAALQIYRLRLGERHPRTINAMNNLGVISFNQERWTEAERYLRDAVNAGRSSGLAAQTILRTSLIYLGRIYLKDKKLKEAEDLFAEAIVLCKNTLPENHWGTFECRGLMGSVLTEGGRFDEAELLLIDSYEGLRRAKGVKIETLNSALIRIIQLYESWPKPEKAAEYRDLLSEVNQEQR